jgi:hypothetical protein
MGSTRRTMLAALLGLSAACGLTGLAAPLRAAPLRLPDTPLRLERRLARALGETATLVVERSWEVRFARQGRGIIVTGTQIAASVDAPPNLAELARIEQQRDTSAMFPLMLTDSGLIMGSPGADLRDADLAAALRAAEALIAQQPAPADARARNLQYLALLHRAGAGAFDTLPADLLFPVNTPVERAETITLPDGLIGSYALAYHARTQSDASWLDQAERRVMTRIDGLERRSTERWRLTLL